MKPHHCSICGGGVTLETIPHQQPWGKELFEFEDVPAWVCTQCGEAFFEAHVAEAIDRIIQDQPQPVKYRQIPVFSLPTITGR
ncbi:MAG: type II toxin-antitoxin system MqsA family antitoxin [Acidobacteria bacterium]|nr:type II toxin-antitoxin system MqsA family antitoxin [Acidobacteriota bacterium]